MDSKPPVAALEPSSDGGHQFVVYGDSCSGVPGGKHEAVFAAVNTMLSTLTPAPEFVCFLGDEVIGLTNDPEALRTQWRYWIEHEMAWLDRDSIPLYHTTGNHTTYDTQSEAVFREMLPYLPPNGPNGQRGLSYFVRRDDLLLVFVNTVWSGFGVEGQVETDWLEQTLTNHRDTRFKLVVGHHPVHPANGYSGPYQRTVESRNGEQFWNLLVNHDVQAYLCSHMLAFDVQVHAGVLQIMTAGAGTSPLMPPDREYHHALQLALDGQGLRYHVLDESGDVREWLVWPLALPDSKNWPAFNEDMEWSHRDMPEANNGIREVAVVCWKFSGTSTSDDEGPAQTLVDGWHDELGFAPLWIGIVGREPFLSVILTGESGRSPHLWRGPRLRLGGPLEIQICLHRGMGPGGVLWREREGDPWSSMVAASAWGPGQVPWPSRWSVAHGHLGRADRPYRGHELHIQRYATTSRLTEANEMETTTK